MYIPDSMHQIKPCTSKLDAVGSPSSVKSKFVGMLDCQTMEFPPQGWFPQEDQESRMVEHIVYVNN